MGKRISPQTRRELLEAIRSRYHESSKIDKTRIVLVKPEWDSATTCRLTSAARADNYSAVAPTMAPLGALKAYLAQKTTAETLIIKC